MSTRHFVFILMIEVVPNCTICCYNTIKFKPRQRARMVALFVDGKEGEAYVQNGL